MNKLWRLLRHDWPLHFILLFTNWLPDNVICLRLRGMLATPFFGSCGKNLLLGRNITFYNPSAFNLGRDIYIAYGCWLLSAGDVIIADEVMFGPYVVLAAGNHTRMAGSFRHGEAEKLKISVGRGTWVGAHSTIMAGALIGNGSLVASGATVLRGDYPENAFLAGVPAITKKVIQERS